MVVPQHAFVSAQPVAKVAVMVSAQQIAAAPLSGRVAVAPTRESVLGARAATAGHMATPPAAVANRQVVAKKTPPPPPVPFAKQQQALAAHPGQPLVRSEVRTLRPAASAAARPMVRQAPPAKPATPAMGHPASPANRRPARSACGDAGESADESSGDTAGCRGASHSGCSGATESFRPGSNGATTESVGTRATGSSGYNAAGAEQSAGSKSSARITTDAEPSGDQSSGPRGTAESSCSH